MTDSGNSSGSSTAGDEEFDSRAGSSSISAFLNNHSSDSLHALPRQQPPLHHLHPLPMFDPLSNFFDPLTRSSDPITNRNMDMAMWAKSHPRPPEQQSCTGDLSGFGIPQMQLQPLSGGGFSAPEISKQVGSASDQASGAVSNSNSHSSNLNNAPRNPKKRSRASRRAPTTVLSTDTANFRAMVQEFTGIPDGPFAGSPFQRSRFDLFGSASGSPSYLLRPFAQKMQTPLIPSFISPPPPPPPSNANASTPNNFPTLFGTLASSPNPNTTTTPSQSLLSPNVQNPILDFQSLFQSPNKYLPTSSIFSNKSLDPDHSKPGGLEEFELGQAAVNTQLRAELPDVDSTLRTNNWSNEPTVPNNHGGINIFRSLEGNFSNLPSPRVENGPNVVCSGAPPLSSEFIGDQGTENNNNTVSKGEGIVESWICSSDYN